MAKQNATEGSVKFDPNKPLGNKATVVQLMESLSKHIAHQPISAQRLAEIAVYCTQRTPRLLECTGASFAGCMLQCAKYGLYPDIHGQCWLIPRRTGPKIAGSKAYEAHFQIGYQGWMVLARRSKEIVKIEPRVVYASDLFDYEMGTDPFIKHKPKLGVDRGGLTAAYCVAWAVGDERPQFVVLHADDIDRIKKKAQNTDGDDSPWVQWEDAMWRKSAIIQLCKYLPVDTEISDAIAMEEATLADKSQGLGYRNPAGLGYTEQTPLVNPLQDGKFSADDLLQVPTGDASGDEQLK